MSHWLFDPAIQRHVRLAPGREARPNDVSASGQGGPHSIGCPFCAPPGEQTPSELDRVENAHGQWLARVVPNRFPAFSEPDGTSEVVIESPDHATRFVDLPLETATAALTLWARRLEVLRNDARFGFQLMFKNEGARAGASLSHTHSQLIALKTAPSNWGCYWRRDHDWRDGRDERTVLETPHFAAFAPTAPRFAGETWIAPHAPGDDFTRLSQDPERAESLARTLQALLGTLPAVGATDFNLVLMLPDRETVCDQGDDWRLEMIPRQATLAGLELATGAYINTLAPEQAAERMRSAMTRLGDSS